MKYQKPLCDCGKELNYYNQEVYDVERNITKKGNLKNKPNYFFEIGSFSAFGAILECKCGNKYDLDYDEKERITRGDKRENY